MDHPVATPVIELPLLLATTAKVLASAIHVSGRRADEAFHHSAPWALHQHQLPEALAGRLQHRCAPESGEVTVWVDVDEAVADDLIAVCRRTYPQLQADWAAEKRHLLSLGRVSRRARPVGDQGCLIVPEAEDFTLHFTPVPVRSALPAEATLPWPLGSADVSPARPGDGSPYAHLAAVLAAAVQDPDALHAAWVVVHRGVLVAEAYRDGITADTQLESWSMGKSVMSTLIGRLVQRGDLALDAPAPVPAWHGATDPRRAITLRHLLTMSSGLQCSGHDQGRPMWARGLPDHFLPYSQALNVAEFALGRASEHAPGTVGRYRNCDPLALACVFRQVVADQVGSDPLTWPQQALFDRIGVRRQTLETDRWGHFIISGFDYGTARNWARLALLYLNDGVCPDGERLLPEGWVRFATSPAPAWARANYGAQIWLNTVADFVLPADTFYFAGGGGQHVFAVPSADLVIVRLGHSRAYAQARANVNAVLTQVLAALPPH